MRRRAPSTTVLAIVLLACGFADRARADASLPDAAKLATEVREALDPPSRSSTRSVEMVTTLPGADAQSVTWQGRQLRKTLAGGRRSLTVLDSPASVAGFSILVSETGGDQDAVWMYVPPVRRVRRIVHPGRYEYVLGTDLASSDFGVLRFDPSLQVREKVLLDGTEAWLLEEAPEAVPGGYSRIRTWIATGTRLPLRRDFYDEAGGLWKVETWSGVEKVDGVPTALEMTARNAQEGSSTLLRFRDVHYDAAIDDRFFEPQTMASASLPADATTGAP